MSNVLSNKIKGVFERVYLDISYDISICIGIWESYEFVFNLFQEALPFDQKKKAIPEIVYEDNL